MRIPNLDETWQHRQLLPALEATVRRVLLDEAYAVGQAAALEEEVIAFLGGGHAVAVQSGTAALFLTLKALGIGQGDEVIAPPNSDLATTASISHTGARFVLCDVEPETMNLDPDRVERRITGRTKAILPVHLYGHPAEMAPIMEIAVIPARSEMLKRHWRSRKVGYISWVPCAAKFIAIMSSAM